MISIVAADVAAYFVGKRFGKTPLIELSPKKTWEGFLGGCVGGMAFSVTGATLMRVRRANPVASTARAGAYACTAPPLLCPHHHV